MFQTYITIYVIMHNSQFKEDFKCIRKPSERCQRMLESWVSCSGNESFCFSSITAKNIKSWLKQVLKLSFSTITYRKYYE